MALKMAFPNIFRRVVGDDVLRLVIPVIVLPSCSYFQSKSKHKKHKSKERKRRKERKKDVVAISSSSSDSGSEADIDSDPDSTVTSDTHILQRYTSTRMYMFVSCHSTKFSFAHLNFIASVGTISCVCFVVRLQQHPALQRMSAADFM